MNGLHDIVTMLTSIMPIIGAIVVVIGLITLTSKLLRPYNGGSYAPGIMLALMGAGMIFTPGLLTSLLNDGEQTASSSAEPTTPAPTPTRAATDPSTPSPSPSQASAPAVQGLSFDLWWLVLIPIGLATVVLVYAIVKRIRKDILAARSAKAEMVQARARATARWATVLERHAAARELYLKAETDWDMLFSMPALQDVSVPQTAALNAAYLVAENALSEQPEQLSEDQDLESLAYPRAVTALEIAWGAAYAHAKRVGQSGLSHEERALIKKIKRVMALAENGAATPSERALAYGRVRSMVAQLSTVVLPMKALAEIESHERLMIEA